MKKWLVKSLLVTAALIIGTGSALANKVSLGYKTDIVGPLLNVIAEKKLEKDYKIKW